METLKRRFRISVNDINEYEYNIIIKNMNMKKILEKVSIESNSDYKLLNSVIISQIDSLQALINTYTFFGDGKTLYLTLAKEMNNIRVYVLDDKNGSNIYIKLKGQYFQINENTKPYKLFPITNTVVIDELRKIEFLNE